MKPKSTLILDNEFIQYCELNNIKDVDKKAKETFNRGFSLLKYGETPKGTKTKEIVEVPVEVIVEKIVERIVEVPVEVIKEVVVEKQGKTKTVTKEVIKEVPVEKIVEVIREVTNNDEMEKLKKENLELKSELDKITSSLEKFSKAKMMKNSDMSSLYDE
jgi:hypothetical protein